MDDLFEIKALRVTVEEFHDLQILCLDCKNVSIEYIFSAHDLKDVHLASIDMLEHLEDSYLSVVHCPMDRVPMTCIYFLRGHEVSTIHFKNILSLKLVFFNDF